MLFSILNPIGFVFVTLVSFVVVAYLLGLVPGGTWFKVMPANSVGIIVKGETVVDILVNVPGYFFNKITEEIMKITEENKHLVPKKGLVESFLTHFGVSVISKWWPAYKLYTVKISRKKKVKDDISNDEELEAYIKDNGSDTTDTLRWRIPRPFIFHNVELKDGGGIHVIYEGFFELVKLNTAVLAIIMSEDLFGRLSSIVQGRQKDKTRAHTIESYFALEETGKDSPFAKSLAENLKTEDLIGYKTEKLWVLDWEPNEKSAELVKARGEEQLAKEKGKGLIAAKTAYRDASAFEAEGDRLLALADKSVVIPQALMQGALTKEGKEIEGTKLNPEQAVTITVANADRDGKTGFGGGTLITNQGTAPTGVMIQASEKQKGATPKEPEDKELKKPKKEKKKKEES